MTTMDHTLSQYKPLPALSSNREPPNTSFHPQQAPNSFPLPSSSLGRSIWAGTVAGDKAPGPSQVNGGQHHVALQNEDDNNTAQSKMHSPRREMPSKASSSSNSNASNVKASLWASSQNNWESSGPSPYQLPSWRRPAPERSLTDASDTRASNHRGFVDQRTGSNGRLGNGLSGISSNIVRLDTRSATVGKQEFGSFSRPNRESPTGRSSRSPPELSRRRSGDPASAQDPIRNTSGFFPFDPELSQGLANPYPPRNRDPRGLSPISPTNDGLEMSLEMERLRLANRSRGLYSGNRPRDYYPPSVNQYSLPRNSSASAAEGRQAYDAGRFQQRNGWASDQADESLHRMRLNSLPESTDYTWSSRRFEGYSPQEHKSESQKDNDLHGLGTHLLQRRLTDDLSLQQHMEAENRSYYGEKLSNQLPVHPNYLPPQMQQSVATHIRKFGTYPLALAMPGNSQVNSLGPYLQLQQAPQLPLPSVSPSNTSPGSDSGAGIRSLLLEEFKSNLKSGRNYELRDIYDHIVEFSGDQNGSRFIQTKLETANSEEKDRVFREIQPNAIQLMMDVFGNYVIQKFFEYGDQNQKRTLTNQMRGQVLSLSLQVYGCRVVQTALKYVLVDQQAAMVKELERDVIRCVKDQNGNHVIQKAIECCRHEHIEFIIAAFIGQLNQLSIHQYGCRVVQRLLERCSEYVKGILLREIFACASTLITDPYGNYVAQNVIEQGGIDGRTRMLNLIKDNLIAYSKQKFASNVVEQMIKNGSHEQRREIMLQLSQKDSRGDTALPLLMRDQYGNYVIQKLLDTLNEDDYRHFVSLLAPEMNKNRKVTPNKHVEVIAKKMNRFDKPLALGFANNALSSLHNYSASPADESIAPTPPLTVDGEHTPRSNSVPSTSDGITAFGLGDAERKAADAAIRFKLSEH